MNVIISCILRTVLAEWGTRGRSNEAAANFH